MNPSPVKVALSIREQIELGVLEDCPSRLVSEFDLEGADEALHRRIMLKLVGRLINGLATTSRICSRYASDAR